MARLALFRFLRPTRMSGHTADRNLWFAPCLKPGISLPKKHRSLWRSSGAQELRIWATAGGWATLPPARTNLLSPSTQLTQLGRYSQAPGIGADATIAWLDAGAESNPSRPNVSAKATLTTPKAMIRVAAMVLNKVISSLLRGSLPARKFKIGRVRQRQCDQGHKRAIVLRIRPNLKGLTRVVCLPAPAFSIKEKTRPKSCKIKALRIRSISPFTSFIGAERVGSTFQRIMHGARYGAVAAISSEKRRRLCRMTKNKAARAALSSLFDLTERTGYDYRLPPA